MGYADIIQVLGAFFGNVYSIRNMRLNWGFYGSLRHTLACLRPALCVVHKPSSRQFAEMHAQKKTRRNAPTFKHYERLISTGFWIRADFRRPFQEGGWSNERGRLCLHGLTNPPPVENFEKKQKHFEAKKQNGTSSSCCSTFLYFDVINAMLGL